MTQLTVTKAGLIFGTCITVACIIGVARALIIEPTWSVAGKIPAGLILVAMGTWALIKLGASIKAAWSQ